MNKTQQLRVCTKKKILTLLWINYTTHSMWVAKYLTV